MCSPVPSPSHSQCSLLGYTLNKNVQTYAVSTHTSSRVHVLPRSQPTSKTSISRGGLVVVKKDEPFCPSRECIVIPRSIIDGLLTALHIKLNHPSRHQLEQVVLRYFYALDFDQALDQCSQTCHTCASEEDPQLSHSTVHLRLTCCCWDIICCRCPKKEQTAHLGRSRDGVFLYYIVHHRRRTP